MASVTSAAFTESLVPSQQLTKAIICTRHQKCCRNPRGLSPPNLRAKNARSPRSLRSSLAPQHMRSRAQGSVSFFLGLSGHITNLSRSLTHRIPPPPPQESREKSIPHKHYKLLTGNGRKGLGSLTHSKRSTGSSLLVAVRPQQQGLPRGCPAAEQTGKRGPISKLLSVHPAATESSSRAETWL